MNTPEYNTWQNLKKRCNDTNNPKYHRYGGRGISYDPRWESFENFYADMGDKPSPNHSLDRYPDNDGDYCKDNCRWATPLEQAANKSNSIVVHYKDADYTVPELATLVGIDHTTLHHRIFRLRWSVEKAVSTPTDRKGPIPKVNDSMLLLAAEVTHRGKSQTEIGDFLGMSQPQVSTRLQQLRSKLRRL
jgi:hypothetical protein